MKNKFFKIPIDKLIKRLPDRYKDKDGNIDFNESQWGMVNGLEEKRFWVHISARRTGKSFAASVLAFAKLLEPNQYVTVVAPNYNLSSIIWDYVTQFIKDLEIETDKFNTKDKVVELVNGSVFRLLSANNRDSLVGRGINLLIVDEAAIIEDDEYFTRDLRAALSTFSDSRALFITTPRGMQNYIYKYFMRAEDPDKFPEWGSAVYTWEVNKLLNKKDIEQAREEMPKNIFEQEYYCSWISFEGQIYPIIRDKHVIDTDDIVRNLAKFEVIAGLDIGFRDATAFVVIATNDTNYYILDSFSLEGETTSKIAANIQTMIDRYDPEHIYIDSAAAQTKADLAYEYDIYCENAQKSVVDGIAAIQVLVEQDRLYLDEERCLDVYNSISGYRWNINTEVQKPLHDANSHYCDAIRYAIYSHQKGKVSIYSKNV